MKKVAIALIFVLLAPLAVCFSACKNTAEKHIEYVSITINKNIEDSCDFKVDNKAAIGTSVKFKIVPNIGYKCLGYYIGEEFYETDVCEIKNIQSDVEIDVVCDYATYEIGICNITAEEEITSKDDYVNMTFSLTNVEDEKEN